MTEKVKLALIAAATAVVCVGLYIYFSPYNTCVRGLISTGVAERYAHYHCAKGTVGN